MIKLYENSRFLKELYLYIVKEKLSKHKCFRCGGDNAKYDMQYSTYLCDKCLKELKENNNG